jgi:hypothetical protein
MTVGTVLGLLAGYYRGKVENQIMESIAAHRRRPKSDARRQAVGML